MLQEENETIIDYDSQLGLCVTIICLLRTDAYDGDIPWFDNGHNDTLNLGQRQTHLNSVSEEVSDTYADFEYMIQSVERI